MNKAQWRQQARDALVEIDALRGAIREAQHYLDCDDEIIGTETGAAISHTLNEALREDVDLVTSDSDLDGLFPDVDWKIVALSMMSKIREIEAWQDSVNRERRKDRARATDAEAKVAAVESLTEVLLRDQGDLGNDTISIRRAAEMFRRAIGVDPDVTDHEFVPGGPQVDGKLAPRPSCTCGAEMPNNIKTSPQGWFRHHRDTALNTTTGDAR